MHSTKGSTVPKAPAAGRGFPATTPVRLRPPSNHGGLLSGNRTRVLGTKIQSFLTSRSMLRVAGLFVLAGSLSYAHRAFAQEACPLLRA